MKLIANTTALFMAMTIPKLVTSAETEAAVDNVEDNLNVAEQAIRDFCLTQDDNGFYTNRDVSYCADHFPGPLGRNGVPQNVTLSPGARKLKQLKMLVLWLQPEHRFARYCYYGCWCLPDTDHADFTPRFGKPVDEIDMSCKKMSQCYECAKMDHGEECDSSSIGYKYELHTDPNRPNDHWGNSITCLDNPVGKKSCRRSICECDKKLAEDLRTNFGFWKQGHHQTQGGFDTSACQVDRCQGGNCQARGPVECCGNADEPRFPFRTNGGLRKCCGNKTYDSSLQECCSNNEIKFMGTC